MEDITISTNPKIFIGRFLQLVFQPITNINVKFYKGDHIRAFGSDHVFERQEWDRVYTAKGVWYYEGSCKLIRRADEPAWPADVPRCELPLPEGKTRLRAKGYGWEGITLDLWIFYWDGKKWTQTNAAAGAPELFYAEAVNDEDYVPPQLSETTNSSQVESKITVERSTMVKHADLHNVASVRIDGGKIFTHLNGLSISASQALALAELLTAAAKEAQQ